MNMREAKIISNYANYVVLNDTKQLNKTDWNIIGKDLKTTDKLRPFITRKIVMSNLELANNKILDILTRNGIDHDKPLKIYNEAYEIAKSKENSGDLIKIADRYTELLDMKPQKVQISETRKEIDYTNMLPNEVKRTITTSKNIDNGAKTRVNTNDSVDNGINTQQPDDDNAL